MQSPSSPPSHRAFSAFPSTSLSSPSPSSPYVTDQPISQLNASLGGRPLSSSSFTTNQYASANGRGAASAGAKADGGATTEVLYEAPENGLEIEVRDPRTQGEPRQSLRSEREGWIGPRVSPDQVAASVGGRKRSLHV